MIRPDSPSNTWTIDDAGDVATVQDETGKVVASFHGPDAYRNGLRFIASFDMIDGIKAMNEAGSVEEFNAARDDLDVAVDLAEMTYEDIQDAEDEPDETVLN